MMHTAQSTWIDRHGGWRFVASLATLLVALGSVVFYVTVTYRAYLNSDAAVANVLAEEIKLAGAYLPKDWWYVNGDLWVVFKHALVLAWLPIGANNFGAHSFSVLGGTALLLTGAFAMLRAAGCTVVQAMLGVSVICVGYSDHYLEIVFGEAAYSWTAAALVWLLALWCGLQRAEITRPILWSAFIALLVFAFAVANPIRFLAFTLVPLAIALVLTRWPASPKDMSDEPRPPLRPIAIAAIGAIGAFFIAALSHQLLLRELSNIHGASAATLIPLEQLPAALAYSVLGLLRLMGVDWIPGTRLASGQGLLALARLLTYPVFLLAPLLVLWNRRAELQPGERMIGFAAASGLVLITLLVASTSLQGGGPVAATYTSRYATPYVLLMLLTLVMLWKHFGRRTRCTLVAGFFLAVVSAWGHLSPDGIREQERLPNAANVGYSFDPGWRARVAERQRVISGLLAAGLRHGYAPYWHSHPYTVLSAGRVEIRPVHMNGGDIRPWLHLSSSRWYKPGYAERDAFLLVPPNEVAGTMAVLALGCSAQPSRKLQIEDYTVLVFNSNPLIGVTTRNLEGKGSVCLSEASLRQVGTFDGAQRVIRSLPTEGPGLIHYGPYQTLERGRYRILFHIQSKARPDEPQKSAGFVEVTAENGKLSLGRAEIKPGATVLQVPLAVDAQALEKIEFRVYSSGTAELVLERIEVQRLDPA